MFTRVVEINAKSGKASELAKAIQDKVLPILKKQTGFMDETVLVSDTEPNRIIGLSFWNSKEDAERYHREAYPKVNDVLSPSWSRRQSSGHSTSTPPAPTKSLPAKPPEAPGGCIATNRGRATTRP